MTDGKKKRMSMLDTLAGAAAPLPAGGMMGSNRALRSARDAVDGHHVWELDPALIDDGRPADRLDPADVADLRASIEQNGQTVPILVRRHPGQDGRYLLVYGRRRLEAVRSSDRVAKVRALIANLDDTAALRAQVSENTARRDLSYIERALFAQELLENGFGTQAQVAEVLNATRSAVSMAISLARTVGPDLARAIGPAHGIGRPRWDAVARDLTARGGDVERLVALAHEARSRAGAQAVPDDAEADRPDPSVAAFEAVARHLRRGTASTPLPRGRTAALTLDGQAVGTLRASPGKVRLDMTNLDPEFADWLVGRADAVLNELHARWKDDG